MYRIGLHNLTRRYSNRAGLNLVQPSSLETEGSRWRRCNDSCRYCLCCILSHKRRIWFIYRVNIGYNFCIARTRGYTCDICLFESTCISHGMPRASSQRHIECHTWNTASALLYRGEECRGISSRVLSNSYTYMYLHLGQVYSNKALLNLFQKLKLSSSFS